MQVPEDLRYAESHEWARTEADGAVRVGITDFAQDALGDVVYVEVPAPGTALSAGDPFGIVESTKSVSDVYAPVSGTVRESNTALEANPELVNASPYGEGWLMLVDPSDLGELDRLLDAAGYAAATESSQ